MREKGEIFIMMFKLVTYIGCSISILLLFLGVSTSAYLLMGFALLGFIDILTEVFTEKKYSRILSIAITFLIVSSFLRVMPYLTSLIFSIAVECVFTGLVRFPLFIRYFKKEDN